MPLHSPVTPETKHHDRHHHHRQRQHGTGDRNPRLAAGRSLQILDRTPLDVFIASDSEEASNQVAAAAGLRPLRVGGLRHARELEGFQLLVAALQANPAYESFNSGTGLKIVN